MILPFEHQVTSFELSKELKSLGLRQDSLYFHYKFKIADNVLSRIGDYQNILQAQSWGYDTFDCYAAYTVAELLKLFPISQLDCITFFNSNDQLFININLNYPNSEYTYQGLFQIDCLGEALAWLVKSGKVKAEDL